jgi:transposase
MMTASLPANPTPKSTLFCPCCGHESPVDGDWVVFDAMERTRYVCPRCEGTITSRPEFDAGDGGERSPTAAWMRCWRAWGRTVSTWHRASRALVPGA